MPHTNKMTAQSRVECANLKRIFEIERARSGMTQQILADMCGKSPKTISAIVNGRMRITIELGAAFAKIFGVPLSEILPWTSALHTDSSHAAVIADLEALSPDNRVVALRLIQNLLDSQE